MSLSTPFAMAYCQRSGSKNISRILSSFIILFVLMVYTKKPATFDGDGPLGLCAAAGLEPCCKFLIVEAPLGGSRNLEMLQVERSA